MTIYKTQPGEKKSDKDPEVLTEPLTGVKDESEFEETVGTAPKLVRVTYFPRRHRTWVNLCLILTALLVLGTGIIAAIFLYRHLSSKVVRGRCGVTYYDGFYHQQQAEPQIAPDTPPLDISQDTSRSMTELDFFEEDIEVSAVDLYERLTVPKFDEVEETVVWHDFFKNLTAIVDPVHRTCYIMPLNRSRISPPRDLIDLVVKLNTRYYMPKASVVREQYRVVLPAMTDLTVLGSIIMRECYHHHTFRLERYVSGVFKRSVDEVSHPLRLIEHYGYFILRSEQEDNIIHKVDVFQQQQQLSPRKDALLSAPPQ